MTISSDNVHSCSEMFPESDKCYKLIVFLPRWQGKLSFMGP